MATPKTQSFAKKLGSDIVTFNVGAGSEMRAFTIHKNILCDKAPHFDTLFNGPFLEGQTQVALLDEDDPDAFEFFVSWVYQGEVEIINFGNCDDGEIRFINLFAFAEKYNLISLADNAMDMLLKKCKSIDWLLGSKAIVLGYQKTHAKSKLRLFLARTYVYVTLTLQDEDASTGWSNEDMRAAVLESEDLWYDTFDLMRGQSGRKQSNPSSANSCDYHHHAENELCPYKSTPIKNESKKERDARIAKENKTSGETLRASMVGLRNMLPDLSNIEVHNLVVQYNGDMDKAADAYMATSNSTRTNRPSKRKR